MSGPSTAQRLAARKQRLLLESAALRGLWLEEVQHLRQPLAWADRAAVAVAWAAQRPWWVLAGTAGAIALAGPRRLLRWSGVALAAWRGWQRGGGLGLAGAVLPLLLARRGQDDAAAAGAAAASSPSSALR